MATPTATVSARDSASPLLAALVAGVLLLLLAAHGGLAGRGLLLAAAASGAGLLYLAFLFWRAPDGAATAAIAALSASSLLWLGTSRLPLASWEALAGFALPLFFAAAAARLRGRWPRRLLAFLALLGAGEALYGLLRVAALWGGGMELHAPRGHFGYRNHFAAFLNLCFFPAAYLLLSARRHRDRTAWLYGLSAVFLAAGIVGSLSRGGIAAWGLGLLGWFFWQKRGGRRYLLAAVGGGALIVLLALGGKPLLQRLERGAEGISFRLQLAESCWAIAADHRWFGAGPGTFPYLYPRYASGDCSAYIPRQAHNDYAQFLAEGGGLGLALAALLLGLAAWRLRRKMALAPQPRHWIAGALAPAGVSFLAQAAVDFPAHLPLLLSAAALLLGLAFSGEGAVGSGGERWARAGALGLLGWGLIALAGAGPGVAWQGRLYGRLSLEYRQSRAAAFLAGGDALAAVTAARDGQRRCPFCADFYSLEGAGQEKQGRRAEALAAYRRGAEEDPRNARRLAEWLRAQLLSEAPAAALQQTVRQIAAIDPQYAPLVLRALAQAGRWPGEAVSLFPTDLPARRALVEALLAEKLSSVAAGLVGAMPPAAVDRRTRRNLAAALLQKGDGAAALSLLQPLAGEAAPGEERGAVQGLLAEAWRQTGQAEPRLAALRESCRQWPAWRSSCQDYLEAAWALGKKEESRAFLQAMARLFPGNSFFPFLLSEYYRRVGEPDLALASLRAALSLEEDDGYRQRLADLLSEQGAVAAAAREYERLYARDPRRTDAALSAAAAWRRAGEEETGRALLRRLLRQQPAFGPAQRMLAEWEGERKP